MPRKELTNRYTIRFREYNLVMDSYYKKKRSLKCHQGLLKKARGYSLYWLVRQGILSGARLESLQATVRKFSDLSTTELELRGCLCKIRPLSFSLRDHHPSYFCRLLGFISTLRNHTPNFSTCPF